MSPYFNEIASRSRILSIRDVSCIVVELQITAYVEDNIKARF